MRTYTSQTLNFNDNLYVGPFGTLTVDYDLLLRVHDNVTPGGHVFNLYDNDNVAAYLSGNIVVGTMKTTSSNTSINDTTGTIIVGGVGGIGVGGNINIGGAFYAAGNINSGNTAIVNALVVNSSIYTNSLGIDNELQANVIVANASITSPLISIENGLAQIVAEQVTDTTANPTIVDSFPITLYRSVHYFAQVTDTANAYYHTTSITVVQDGTNAYKSEYNVIAPEGRLGNFNANVSAGSCTLIFTANSATNKVINLLRTGISV
jgi:hypothetical protein